MIHSPQSGTCGDGYNADGISVEQLSYVNREDNGACLAGDRMVIEVFWEKEEGSG